MIFYVCPVGGHTCGTSALFFFFWKMGKNSKDALMENHKARLDPNSWVMWRRRTSVGGNKYSVGKNTCKVQNYTINRKSSIKFQEFALSSKSSKVACSGLWRNKSLQSNHFFLPSGNNETQKRAKPQEDVWHFHDLSKDDSVATIPEENTYIKIEYITQKIALCATGLKKKKIYTSAGLQYVICA